MKLNPDEIFSGDLEMSHATFPDFSRKATTEVKTRSSHPCFEDRDVLCVQKAGQQRVCKRQIGKIAPNVLLWGPQPRAHQPT